MPTITLLARRQPLQAPHGLAEATCPTGRPGIQPQFHVTPCRVLFVNTRKSRTSRRALAVTITGKRPPRPATSVPPLLPHSSPPLRLVAERSFPAQSDRSSRRSRPRKLFRRCRTLATDKPNPHFVPPAGLHLAALWPKASLPAAFHDMAHRRAGSVARMECQVATLCSKLASCCQSGMSTGPTWLQAGR